MIFDGIVLVNKPMGMTSHDVVNKIRRFYGTKKVGHTGTLDPMATGVMAVLIGRATKAADMLLSENKSYVAGMRLGITTDTGDITGTVLSSSDDIPNEASVLDCLLKFKGDIKQVPPMYSALKVGGKKLCDLARQGIEVERNARDVTIHSIDGKKVGERDYILEVHVSKGTYIRTLCEDIGKALGCGAAMSSLERTGTGGFTLGMCHTLEEIEKMTEEERWSLLLPLSELFSELPSLRLSEFFTHLAASGNEIYQKKVKTNFEIGERVAFYTHKGVFFALGEVKEYSDGSAIKPIKQFELNVK